MTDCHKKSRGSCLSAHDARNAIRNRTQSHGNVVIPNPRIPCMFLLLQLPVHFRGRSLIANDRRFTL